MCQRMAALRPADIADQIESLQAENDRSRKMTGITLFNYHAGGHLTPAVGAIRTPVAAARLEPFLARLLSVGPLFGIIGLTANVL